MVCSPGFDCPLLTFGMGGPMLKPFIGSALPPPIALLLEFEFSCIPAELGVELCSVADVGLPLTATGFCC